MTLLTALTYIGFVLMIGLVLFMGYQVGSQLYKRKKKTGRFK
ncbi:hypothetical protein A5819_003618 [Enterococcus sp. 7E2_DIV0204]|nr:MULTISPECIES: hypothetical protein [unclassified Enterococcus]OTN84068.1 hypothetical protein A5819_003618 [Enterococcus sp. 7E2_DIV0204]OTP47244.1 hypothetical protein A5884_003619 [Enterococcus sp. 7D2_DIV0200]